MDIKNRVHASVTNRRCGYAFKSAVKPRAKVTRAAANPIATAAEPSTEFQQFEQYIIKLQDTILATAEKLDGSGKTFMRDHWSRDASNPNAGYGITCVLEGGNLLEKAAANISVVKGTLTAARAQSMSSRGRSSINPNGGQPYAAAAMSLVFHSAHAMVPTLRADVRLFQVGDQSWYGGGCDLTPSYLFEDDAKQFHTFWRDVCAQYSPDCYPKFKKWCDDYFYIPARKEHRGIGGLFFDDLSSSEVNYDVPAFVRDVGDGILPSWLPIAQRRRSQQVTQQQRDWQLLRRGRYLEFNLLYDRGVKFGLDGGRLESIMVSAPPLIAWKYNVQAEAGSAEEQLVQVLQSPREWV